MATASRGMTDQELFLSRPVPEDGGDSPTVEPLRIFKPTSPQPSSRTSSASTSRPAFPLPPGASSSAAPLPFPDDDDMHRPTPAKPYGAAYNDTTPRLDTGSIDKRPGLAERRGAAPKLIHSPSSPDSDQGLFARPLKEQARPAAQPSAYSNYQNRTYYPPPGAAGSSSSSSSSSQPQPQSQPQSAAVSHLKQSDQAVNRFPSTASNSTTKATRGSPPPPETPIVEPGVIPGGGIEARYAASGISGTATLTSLQASQAQSAAAAQRLAQYGNQAPQPQRPWTPTETPDQAPSGPPTVYQGSNVISSPQPQRIHTAPPQQPAPIQNSQSNQQVQVSVLEQDFQRLGNSSPPPAYSSVNPGGNSSYPNEKRRPQQNGNARPAPAASQPAQTNTATSSQKPAASKPVAAAAAAAAAGSATAAQILSPALQHPGHPAFANDPRPEPAAVPQQNGASAEAQAIGPGPASPPPLPEGWIAHLDQNSGQYYYIHLATQATQWEFPKGPNPIQPEQTPLSPTASTYGNPLVSPVFGKQSLASPMFPPHTPGYAESIMSVAVSQAPTAGFSGPPPSAGVDMYRVQPTNGVYFGPYLRYVNMDIEKGIWYGSILIVTDSPQPPTIHIHLSADLSPSPRQLEPHAIYTHQRWTFYKYDIDLQMGEGGTERWTYAVTSHLGCTRYEFVVAGRHETGWKFIAHSGNDFAASTSQNERAKLGGVGFMWKDVLQKNVDCGGFHAQLGLGDQIYGDRLWKEVPLLKQWLAMSGRDNKKSTQWTARHEEDVSHAYFHYYTSHFDQPFLREAFAQIPHVLQIDDHDIFDGYGSYPQYMQASPVFKNIGRVATEMYLLFQHHTTVDIMRNVRTDHDIFTITGTGWHFVKYLGPAMAVVGTDCRSERTQARVMAGPTYQGIFPKVATLPPSVQHVIWMVSVPLVFPRLEAVESIANTVAAGKKAVNTTYNILGKVTSSVAGVVGGKEVVAQGFSQVKKAVGKTGLMGNVLNQFGELDIQEVLKDMWTHETKDLERTYFIRTLQGIAQQKGVRMTFLSGDVNSAGAGLVHDPTHPGDHKTMYQIITSPIVAAPQGGYVLKLLHNQKTLYVPQNGQKSTHEVSDTKEDMMEIFHNDASGGIRELKKLMGRRNYAAFVAYDQEAIMAQNQPPFSPNPSINSSQQGLSKLSLAIDFVVQGDGPYSTTTKYGPVIIPHLEFGR
ncbi:WW domain containing protein [Cordyceps fumosorosea ARSEF 2679]|uniref:WW domain containing protein n=1 Tax=Cordyceps fumosorosea (strain ARSEF 2679) TaxID=1081104 RepID=A0A162LEF8_CORFA|nr:WW domain containing protein [Cordyceps fumosorosea ARSEF 2679]OAA69484.1 WW domain containing protein [Cordyceps fumosorosea ARSEF 2679]